MKTLDKMTKAELVVLVNAKDERIASLVDALAVATAPRAAAPPRTQASECTFGTWAEAHAYAKQHAPCRMRRCADSDGFEVFP
jgi:LPS O-antigen subunit length determinant protein (WzzB/FepE family)